MSDQKVDPESRNYSFDQIEDDPRLKRTTKEFFITIGVYAIYAALMILNLYIFGSKDPSTYKYILGFPQWIFNLVCLLIGMVITVDRMEKGTGELSAVQEVKRDFDVDVYSIVNMEDIIEAIRNEIVPGKEYLDKMIEYRNTYGV